MKNFITGNESVTLLNYIRKLMYKRNLRPFPRSVKHEGIESEEKMLDDE